MYIQEDPNLAEMFKNTRLAKNQCIKVVDFCPHKPLDHDNSVFSRPVRKISRQLWMLHIACSAIMWFPLSRCAHRGEVSDDDCGRRRVETLQRRAAGHGKGGSYAMHNQNRKGSGFRCGHWDNFLLLENKGDGGLTLKYALCVSQGHRGSTYSQRSDLTLYAISRD